MSIGPFYDPFKGKGTLMSLSPDKAVWYWEDDEGNIATCTQTLTAPIIEDNKRELNDSAGKRWGDGKIVASIPLAIYFDKLAEANRVGDERYIKKFLNDSDNRAFRRFGGRV